MPPFDPSCLGEITEGIWASTTNCLPSSTEFEESPGSRDSDSNCTQHESPGNYPCGVSRCETCPILIVTDEFSSHTTGKVFRVNFRPSCKSSNVIYLITCRRCGLHYVGETGQPLHMRINGHWYDIAHRRTEESPVAQHFNSGAHGELDMAVMAIELARSRDACLRKIRESRWIRTLGTSFPLGMNLRIDGL